MRVKLCLFLIGLAFCNVFLYAQDLMLDGAILNFAVRVSRDLPANTSIAIVNFSSNSAELNGYVMDETYGALLRQRMISPLKLEQNQLQSIRSEMRFNETGSLTNESAQTIGRLLGVQQLITGTINSFGTEYRIIFDVVNTRNTEQRTQYSNPIDVRNDGRFVRRGLFGDYRVIISNAPVVGSSATEAASSSGTSGTPAPSTNQPPTVTGVSIIPAETSAVRGWTQKFNANVAGINIPDKSVTWTVIGSTNADTSISADGVLTVAPNESRTELTVQATSVFNPQFSAKAVVTINTLTVTGVQITPDNARLNKGKKYNFKATVSGTFDPPQEVTWSVKDASNEKTTISEKGVLTVAPNETSSKITIQAASKFDPQINGTVTITILPPPVNFLSVEASVLGGGVRYERFLTEFFSVGVNAFGQLFEHTVDAGALAVARVFPGNSVFFFEVGLGYGYREGGVPYEYESDGKSKDGQLKYGAAGIMVNPAAGLRFGRKSKGFFADVFFSVPIVFGERTWVGFSGGPDETISSGIRCGVGLGGAW